MKPSPPPVWATFHDIRRYGGLQILLRAMIKFVPSLEIAAAGKLARYDT